MGGQMHVVGGLGHNQTVSCGWPRVCRQVRVCAPSGFWGLTPPTPLHPYRHMRAACMTHHTNAHHINAVIPMHTTPMLSSPHSRPPSRLWQRQRSALCYPEGPTNTLNPSALSPQALAEAAERTVFAAGPRDLAGTIWALGWLHMRPAEGYWRDIGSRYGLGGLGVGGVFKK